jgi:hypothetical protein
LIEHSSTKPRVSNQEGEGVRSVRVGEIPDTSIQRHR